jgi:putative restriction endonuclease
MIDERVRSSVFLWLRERGQVSGWTFDRADLQRGFYVDQSRVTLVGPAGIWKPQCCELPISITSVVEGPYPDRLQDDDLLIYKYRGTDPYHRDNVGLREAMRTRTPLVYFLGLVPGKYLAVWPVTVLEDRPDQLSFVVAVEPAYIQSATAGNPTLFPDEYDEASPSVRKYAMALTRSRLHQASFRERVVAAHDRTCAICRLHHPELLDAAHIIPDSEPSGDPIVQNGLCLCKIHHAAYDQNIIGVSPDYVTYVRPDILGETDGPMLRYGLQSTHKQHIIVPTRQDDRPDPERLDQRYQRFLIAG